MVSQEQELQETLKTDLNSPSTNRVIVENALTEMNFSESAKQLLLDPKNSQTDLDSLQSIALTQEHLIQVKKSLGAIVDSLQENPSLISRAAKFWGELPLWQRIIGGVVISGPTLVIGAAAHIGFLVTISGVSAIAYTTSGIVLDDHHYHTKNIAEKLKKGIFGVAEVLELTIGALDSIRKKLAIEVERFKAENDKLAKNITQLNNEVETLGLQVEVYVKTEELLRGQKAELEKITQTLKKNIAKQGEQFEAKKIELAKVEECHKKSIGQLAEKAAELAEVRKSMGAEIEKAKKISSTLEGTVKALTSAVSSDSSQRQAFQEKLNSFLSEKTTNFDQVAERMSNAEKELSAVKSELDKSNQRYKNLLHLQEKLIRRLELLDQQVDFSINPPVKTSGLLSALSFMSIPLWSGSKTELEVPKPAQDDPDESAKTSAP